MDDRQLKYLLSEKDLPQAWYNLAADLPEPLPPYLHPGTLQPITPDDLGVIFPMDLIMQEVSPERYISIPGEVLDVYRLWRPTPLRRARRLEKALDTPAKIYYKDESVSPVGSHKPNTAVAQAYYNKKAGIKRLSTETGAGQWGSALSMACKFMGMDCTVYMVKVSYHQKPYRRLLMEAFGSKVYASPSRHTHAGREILAKDPESPGSLGIAISEAVEDAATHGDTNYSLGSVLSHVLLHQTVIGIEAQKQMEMAGDYPDVVIACVGGGSNFGGIANPYLADKLSGKSPNLRIVAVEPEACPTLTRGPYAFDYGDTAKMAPVVMMYTLGHGFVPSGIHAGGLRYHGASPLLSAVYARKLIEAVAYMQIPVFEAAMLFTNTEGMVPAPESAHAVRAAIDEALKCKESGEAKTILFNLSGHGYFDMQAYQDYMAGKLQDFTHPQEKIDAALQDLPKVPA